VDDLHANLRLPAFSAASAPSTVGLVANNGLIAQEEPQMQKHLVRLSRGESLDGAAPSGRRVHPVRESWTRRELLRGGAAVVLGMSAAELLAACSTPATASPTPVPASPATPSPRIPEVSLVVTDTSFDAPETLSAGIVRVSLENKGGVPWNVGFLRVREGKTFDEVKANFPRPNSQLASFSLVFEAFGACDGVLPGQRRQVVLDLTAGTYALLSRATGAPAGMVKQLVVSQASGATAPEPAADATVSLKDGVGPAVPTTVKAATTWKVTNDGQLPHVFQIFRFKSGKTAADLASFFANPGSGPAPAEIAAGSGLLTPGKHAWFTSELAPGEYLHACTVPGRNPPANHFNEGESAKITVG
jgi:uncharacterized cupredoxin-like copper-binding protein